MLRRNTICDNGQNVQLPADPTVDLSGNDICEDAPASPGG